MINILYYMQAGFFEGGPMFSEAPFFEQKKPFLPISTSLRVSSPTPNHTHILGGQGSRQNQVEQCSEKRKKTRRKSKAEGKDRKEKNNFPPPPPEEEEESKLDFSSNFEVADTPVPAKCWGRRGGGVRLRIKGGKNPTKQTPPPPLRSAWEK